LELRLAFIYFHPANRVCVCFGPKPRIVLISHLVMSFHKFHISCQTNRKACGWSNKCPRPTQILTYGETSNQAYATKHICLLSLLSG